MRASVRELSLVVERDQHNAFVGCVVPGETDSPAPRLPQLIVVGFPLVSDAGAAVRNQAREIRMIGKVLGRLFERSSRVRTRRGYQPAGSRQSSIMRWASSTKRRPIA